MKPKKRMSNDDTIWAEKRARQAKSRLLVESGARTQESMFFIAPSIARSAVVLHRVLSFDIGAEGLGDHEQAERDL